MRSPEWRALVDRVHKAEQRAEKAERDKAALEAELRKLKGERGPRAPKPPAPTPSGPRGRVYSEDELDQLTEEVADQWGVPDETAEELITGLASVEDVADYIEALWEHLTDLGYDIELSDLWDMYYGYSLSDE